MSLSTEERRAQEERDKKSIKCAECGRHIMLWNSIRWVDAVEAQHRPIYGKEEQVILEGSCLSRHRVRFKGVLIVQSRARAIGKYISHFARKGMPAVTEMKERSHSVINDRRRLRHE